MNNTKILMLNKEKASFLVKLTVLFGLAIVLPFYHQQMITGPIVNAVLFLTTMLLGAQYGMLISLIPSVMALSVGLLPAVLAPVVPFIMISNAILVMTFDILKKKNYWLAMISASVLKFIFLYATSTIVINLLLKKEVAAKVSVMLSWPQLLTALIGGLLAYGFMRFYRARQNRTN